MTDDAYRAEVAGGQKWCGACRAWHDRSAFGLDRHRGDGMSTRCRDSRERRDAPSKRARREQRAAGRAWCRHCAAWCPLDDVRAGLCREHTRAEARRVYAAGGYRHKAGVSAARRRNVAALGPDTRELLMETTGGLCAYGCGRPATSIDHVIPVKLGGLTEPGNVVPACRSCNSSKRAGDPLPWIERLIDDARDLVAPGLLYDGAVLDWLNRAA